MRFLLVHSALPFFLLAASCGVEDALPNLFDVQLDANASLDASAADDARSDATTSDAELRDVSMGDATSVGLLVECEELSYEISCDDQAERPGGYFACSDYFGDTTGVEAQCSVTSTVDVRTDGPPCGAYEHVVGSCVYFVEALPDRCYVTHVGATSADRVEAGREFWRTACAGEWLE